MIEHRSAIILFGPPGSGKSTIAAKLDRFRNTRSVETGDMLRAQVKKRTGLGKKVKPYLDGGRLAPSDLVSEIVRKELEQISENTIVFDGFPRLEPEVETFFQIGELAEYELSLVVLLDLPRSRAINRFVGRLVCPHCGMLQFTVCLSMANKKGDKYG